MRNSVDAIIEACTKSDSSVSLGMAARIEELMKETENTAYSWMHSLLEKLLSKLLGIFARFVVSAIRTNTLPRTSSRKSLKT